MIGRLKEAVSILQSGTAPDATIIDELIVSIDEYVKFTKETPKDSSIEIIENYQTLVQCTVSLLNKFNIILNAKNDDIFTIGKLDADQFDKRTINEPDYRSKVISSLLNLVSLVASINPKAFLSHWPLVLNDSLRVENSIESTSQPLMRIIERLQFCASLKEVALLSDEVNSLRKCIHTAPFRSIIFQSWFSPQLHKTDLPAIAIRCLQHMLTGVSLDRWLIQQTHHDSPKSAIPLNVGSKLLQTDIDYVRTVGVIGQGRSVVGKYSSLKFTEFPSSSSSSSSMEGKVTRAVLKILRVLSIELTLCYMDLVTAETVIMLRDCVSRLGPLLDLSSVLLLHIPLQNTFSSAGLNTRNEIESLCGDIFWLALRLSCQSQLSSSDMLRSTEQTSKGWKKSSCNESPRAMSSREAEDAMKEAQLIALKWCQSIM